MQIVLAYLCVHVCVLTVSSCHLLHGRDVQQSPVQSSAVQAPQGTSCLICCICVLVFVESFSPWCCQCSKSASTPLRIHQYSKRLINKIGFRGSLLVRDSDFLSHTHQSLTNVTRQLMLTSDFGTKLFHHSPPQGVSTSVLCRDVAWLTEELLFRNKDVGFGGSLTEVVHYSLSLLAPCLIIATAPSRLVFLSVKR